jgi:GNAT superfamily N-acetyltransferase
VRPDDHAVSAVRGDVEALAKRLTASSLEEVPCSTSEGCAEATQPRLTQPKLPSPTQPGQPPAEAAAADPTYCEPLVVRDADDSLRRMSIDLFRKYFSPSMHFVFPLIAYRQALHGLDFTSTHTWGVRAQDEAVGAVAWRVRTPLLTAHARDAGRLPVKTLEVLFISVWEIYRNADYGGALVAALEEEAVSQGCGLLYVEVGHEQPLARKFWAKRGFGPASRGVSQEQRLFFEHSCLRFADTEPFVKRVALPPRGYDEREWASQHETWRTEQKLGL